MKPRPGPFRPDWRSLRAPLLLGALLALFFFPLADPQAVLATRDMVEYHLPMRAAVAELADGGFPQWDPFAHGGQPLLSNPNYGALYPLSWLALLLPVAQAVNLMVLIHAALAAWGAYRLARHLGARAAAATLAALAYTCGPTFLPLLHTLNIALAMSFLPWVMEFALAVLDASPGPLSQESPRGLGARRPWCGLIFSLTAIFILGDPLIVAMTLLAIAAFVLAEPRRRLARLPQIASAAAFAIGLAAVQLLPTLARLADSPRAAGLDWTEATSWSFPWRRLIELVFPHFFGDVSRPESGLYFGWGVHDRDYPYLLWIAIGLPLLLLGLAAWVRPGIRERASLALMASAGIFLALGRHNPLYRWAWTYLPGVDKVRFPEKFLLLALIAAIFAGALGWQRLLDRRDADDPRAAALPAALAAGLAALAAVFAGLAFRAPGIVASFAGSHSGLPPSGETLARTLQFYRRESLLATGFTLATLALFALALWRRTPRRALEGAALVLVALELWTYGQPLLRTLPANVLFAPPAVAHELPAPPLRLFSDEPYRLDKTDLVARAGDPRASWMRAPIERLGSRTGNLFGYSYVLDRDFDLSLTQPATRALRLYERIRADPELELRLLGGWSVSHLTAHRATSAILDEARRVGPARAAGVAPVAARANGLAAPPYRFVAGAELFADAATAERAAVDARLPLESREYLIAALPEAAAETLRKLLAGRLDDAVVRAVADRGDQVRVAYAAARPALLVVATTFDSRWQAASGDLELPVFETAAGYMALLVPAGEGEVVLRFRDPWVSLGAATSATTILVALGLALRARRRARAAVAV